MYSSVFHTDHVTDSVDANLLLPADKNNTDYDVKLATASTQFADIFCSNLGFTSNYEETTLPFAWMKTPACWHSLPAVFLPQHYYLEDPRRCLSGY